jgi:RiboL-PSP-HEPN
MTSNAQASFAKNCEDIDELQQVFAEVTDASPGRRRRLGAIHKSVFVLLTAFWEAFCEDIAAEALQYLVTRAPDAQALPLELRKQVARDLADDQNALAAWKLAGDGWRSVLVSRLESLQEARNRRLSTPNTRQTDDFFHRTLGIEKISDSWHWTNMSAQRAAEKLDEYLVVRHEVAHRGKAAYTIWQYDVNEYYNHVCRLVERTADEIAVFLASATGASPWPGEAGDGEEGA